MLYNIGTLCISIALNVPCECPTWFNAFAAMSRIAPNAAFSVLTAGSINSVAIHLGSLGISLRNMRARTEEFSMPA